MKTLSRARLPLLIIAALLGSSSCGLLHKSGNLNSSGSSGTVPFPGGSAGVKNVDQLSRSMSAATGVAVTDKASDGTSPLSQNAVIGPWLSPDGNVQSVNSSMLLSITGLAGVYCKIVLQQDGAIPDAQASTRKLHVAVSFSAGPKGLSSSVLQSVINTYAMRFWQRNPTADEVSILTQSATDAAAALSGSMTGATAVQNILLVPCTAALSAIDAIKG